MPSTPLPLWRSARQVPVWTRGAAWMHTAADVSRERGVTEAPAEPYRPGWEQLPSAMQRLSAAGRLGSSKVQGHASVALPRLLEEALENHIHHIDKPQLRRDANHLAALGHTPPTEHGLTLAPTDHFLQSLRGSRATGLYLATKLPARYAILVRLLDEARRRILTADGQPWTPDKITDWNCNAADVLWAALATLEPNTLREYSTEAWSQELLSCASHLVRDVRAAKGTALSEQLERVRTVFRLRGDKPVAEGKEVEAPRATLAVHAYGLAGLPNDGARERQVLRMWKSRPDVLVFVEEATPRGFASIAAARAQLLALGRTAQTASCHVVAPCPHDRACPMLHPDTLVGGVSKRVPAICSYTQLYHAPSVTRATASDARSDRMEEYTYVIMQRTPRPSLAASVAGWTEALPQVEPSTVQEGVASLLDESKGGVLDSLRAGAPPQTDAPPPRDETAVAALADLGVDADHVLKRAAMTFPRLVRTPLKKGGHVTMDACSSSGTLERFTVAKSAGRQAYQDARKARQGELYAHADKAGRSVRVRDAVDRAAYAPDTQDTPERTPHVVEHEYMYIGPDAQLYARTAGTSRALKRRPRRAPQRRILAQAKGEGRLSRKPNRAKLDEELNRDGWS